MFAKIVLFPGLSEIRNHNVRSRVQKLKCLQVLLYGVPTMTFQMNKDLFKVIHQYIKDSKRFI